MTTILAVRSPVVCSVPVTIIQPVPSSLTSPADTSWLVLRTRPQRESQVLTLLSLLPNVETYLPRYRPAVRHVPISPGTTKSNHRSRPPGSLSRLTSFLEAKGGPACHVPTTRPQGRPLFSGYIFSRFPWSYRGSVFATVGLIDKPLLRFGSTAAIVSELEIQMIRELEQSDAQPFTPDHTFKPGDYLSARIAGAWWTGEFVSYSQATRLYTVAVTILDRRVVVDRVKADIRA